MEPLQQSDDWEFVAAHEVHAVDALKQEGNALFQKQLYFDAIQVYARALAQLPQADSRRSFANEDRDSLLKLEVAVRLNRALAYIELLDDKLLAYAEEDCSLALQRQPDCVKAFYRRALARERMGNIQAALSDAETMHALEPANPAAHQLVMRLKGVWNSCHCNMDVHVLAHAVEKKCVVRENEKPPAQGVQTTEPRHAVNALDAWQALQDEEIKLRQVITKKVPSKATRSAAAAKKTKKTKRATEGPPAKGGEVLAKTDSLWAMLAQEEASTVAGVYKRKANPTNKTTTKFNTASIHPSRR